MRSSASFILAIDQGTTGSRAVLYDSKGKVRASAYQEFRQYYPEPGWVEHDPEEILRSVSQVVQRALHSAKGSPAKIAAIGITNQRETSVLWEKGSGRPVGRAIVWQDRRTADDCRALQKRGRAPFFRKRTGLPLDPYFSATKILWWLNHSAALRNRARQGKLCFGTIDSWLLWNLTGGKVHATDPTNASRTLLFNLRKLDWDSEILKFLKIPAALLPATQNSSSHFGKTAKFGVLPAGIPIHGIAGDQQAALYGQSCYRAGEMKNTYGTGCFLVMNEGRHYREPAPGLLSTVACDRSGNPCYALEGSVFIAGAAIQWLRDGLQLIERAGDTEKIARSLGDESEVVMVPALTGLGAPYWNPDVRGAIFGLTRGTRRAHLVKAALDSIALQTADVFEIMKKTVRQKPRFLRVDGGAAANNYLMQFQADLLGVPVFRNQRTESTAWGAAKLAGTGCGFWPEIEKLDAVNRYDKFVPKMPLSQRKRRLTAWQKTVRRLLN